MPLIKPKSKKPEMMPMAKDSARDLAIAYGVQKQSSSRKKMAQGGPVELPAVSPNPTSIAQAIMAKKRPVESDDMIDIEDNAEEMPNEYYARNEEILKENYDDDMEDVSQPMDSNEMGDDREMASGNKRSMISAIRMKMKSKGR